MQADDPQAGVLCLAFPLRPPARAGKEPGPSRLPELEGVEVPLWRSSNVEGGDAANAALLDHYRPRVPALR